MFKTASHICILCAKLTQPRLSLSLFWYHQIVLFMWVSLPKLCMHFFSICSSDYIVLIDTNQVYSHANTVQGFVYREYLFYLISWLWCWCKLGWAAHWNDGRLLSTHKCMSDALFCTTQREGIIVLGLASDHFPHPSVWAQRCVSYKLPVTWYSLYFQNLGFCEVFILISCFAHSTNCCQQL